MPNAREVAYWEMVAEHAHPDESTSTDNIWKRPHQLERLFKYNWINERVLEIGVGNGVVASVIGGSIHRKWNYIGTELSPRFAMFATKRGKMSIVSADVTELPEPPSQGYTRIIALDSLEHVKPDDRDVGYRRIADVAADGCLLFIHYSLGTSLHNKEFDHPFGLHDICALEKNGFRLISFEQYDCQRPKFVVPYCFVVMKREARK